MMGEDFKSFIMQVRSKKTEYMQRQTELDALRIEYGVLSRTEQILKLQNASLIDQVEDMEHDQGVQGFKDTAETMHAVGEQKMEIDLVKGKTLEEISKVVNDINLKIKERKADLAPQIKKLRVVRQKFQEREAEYNTTKQRYRHNVFAGCRFSSQYVTCLCMTWAGMMKRLQASRLDAQRSSKKRGHTHQNSIRKRAATTS